jgi:hypothetical protein
MQIDYDYLKNLLGAFEATEISIMNIIDLESAGFDIDGETLPFHMHILNDQNFIRREDGEYGFGVERGLDGSMAWTCIPLRMTAQGHEFLAGLRNEKIWKIVTKKLRTTSFEIVAATVKELLVKTATSLA